MIKHIKEGNESAQANDRILATLHRDFPHCFTREGKFDLEKFSNLVQGKVEIAQEGYELNFLGKSYANLIANTETETVIVPDIENNSKAENKDSQNIYISGDNLDALKHLLKSYTGSIKCIYIDPPYNTGSDGFVYNDRFDFTAEQLQIKLGVNEEKAQRILDLTKRGSASHSAWLMFMGPRLTLARELLSDDGVIFISIDDNEQANLKLLCDEIFGEENYVGQIPWRKRTAKSDVPFGISQDYEWIICFAKSQAFYAGIEKETRRYYETPDFPDRPWRIHDLTTQRTSLERPNSFFTIVNPKTGDEYPANPNRVWAVTQETFTRYFSENRIIFPGDYDFLNISKPVLRYWKHDDIQKSGENFGKISVSTKLPDNVGMSQDGTKEIKRLFGNIPFSFPKNTQLIKYIIKISTSETDCVIDFFSGSATTADAIMHLNAEDSSKRRFIMVQIQEQTPANSEARKAGYETIDQIGQERIRRAARKIREAYPDKADTLDLGFKHYTLQDVPQNTLDKVQNFDPTAAYADADVLANFGKETVLATWMVQDGYGFAAEAEKLQLSGYTAYFFASHLYFITGENFDEDAMIALMDKYNREPDFNPQNIVVFGYSFDFVQMEMLRKNMHTLVDSAKNLKINLDIRY